MKLNKKICKVGIILDEDMMYIQGKYKKLFQFKGSRNRHISDIFSRIYDDIKLILDVVKEIKNNDKVFKM